VRGAAFDDIEEPVTVQVDEPGEQQRRVLGGGGEERGLIQTQRGGRPEPGQMIDPRPAVVAHRRHGGVPGHPEAAGDLGARPARFADEAADLGTGPLGQRRPGRDLIDLLGPRRDLAVRIGTPPGPLGPHQHHRPIRHGQVADLDRAPAVADGPRPQPSQPTTSAVVSTASHHSRPTSIWAPTTNSGIPRSVVAPSLRCITVRGLLFCNSDKSQNHEAPDRAGGPLSNGGPYDTTPRFIA
jgi:hypothetical protein